MFNSGLTQNDALAQAYNNTLILWDKVSELEKENEDLKARIVKLESYEEMRMQMYKRPNP